MISLGIDARVLARLPHHGLGVWRYLVRILERAPADGWTITLFVDRPPGDLPTYAFSGSCRFVQVPRPLGVASDAVWEQMALPRDPAFRRQALFWSPSYSTPLLTRVPRVVTMHDISFDQPPPGEARGPWRMRWIGRRSARAARLVLTDSAYSADQMRQHWHTRQERLRVIPLAADRPAGDWLARRPEALARLDLQAPYLLYVGTMYSRRHVATLIEALEPVLRAHPEWQAVLVGRNRTHPHEDLEGATAALNAAAGRRAVLHLPFVSDDDLEVLYGGAGVFVYLSTLEGFGIPPLEAMAHGVPVVSTDGGSLAEVTPGAAVLVPPRDVGAVRAAITRLLEDPGYAATYRLRSLARAGEFSWDRCAAATWDALRQSIPLTRA